MPKKKAAKNPGAQSLLVELLTEELPPKNLRKISNAFGEYLYDFLSYNRFLQNTETEYLVYTTPRRIAAVFPTVHYVQEDRGDSVRKGPSVAVGLDKNGKPTNALVGFARSIGVPIENLERVSDGKLDYFVSRVPVKRETLDAKLADIVDKALKALPIPKMMHWGNSEVQFARPVHGLVMMHGRRIIPGKIWGLESCNYTLGHRFLSSGEIKIPAADQYETVLEKQGSVIASFAKRKELIRAELQKKAAGAKIIWDDALLDEVTALVEYPVVYSGSFSPEFLVLPQECLIVSMQQHQRYFPLSDANGKLLPRFLMVSNMRTANPANIIRGNERVLRARLADAKFFYDQDHKEYLQARVPRLAQVVYHHKLGSQLDRVIRIQELAGRIAHGVGADVELTKRAAWLSKADLLTGMVGEFPELQGVMGGYYADDDHEDSAVVRALADQYKLRFEEDSGVTPESLVSACLYLADRIDALVGFFGIGETPTGEKDPFGLRRAALGIISAFELIGAARKIAGKEIPDVRDFLTYASSLFPTGLLTHRVVDQVHDFILERYWNNLAAVFPKDAVEAVISQRPNLAEVNARVQAVQTFRKLPEAESLASENKRTRKILKKSDAAPNRLDEALLKEPTEQALYDSVKKIEPQIESNMLRRDYTGALKILAGIRVVVDKFFDDVLVNTEDMQLRANRLALLHRLNKLMNQVADISKLAQ